MIHSNGIALLTLDKTHIAHSLLKNPPKLDMESQNQLDSDVNIHRSQPCSSFKEDIAKLNEAPFGFSIHYEFGRYTSQTYSRREFYRYIQSGKELQYISSSKEAIPIFEDIPEDSPSLQECSPKQHFRKNMVHPDTTIGKLVITFYYSDTILQLNTRKEHIFPIIPGIPCEVIETNNMLISAGDSSTSTQDGILATLHSPYDQGYIFVLNPTWKFRSDVFPLLVEAAKVADEKLGNDSKTHIPMESALPASLSRWKNWQLISRKTETDLDVASNLK